MNKASGGDGIPVELFQIKRRCCESAARKCQFSFQSLRKAMTKNAQTTAQLHSSHNLSKVMLKILQARLQQYVNHELPNVQAGFRKGRGIRDQIGIIHWITEKAREF